jgi:hypothetical protein
MDKVSQSKVFGYIRRDADGREDGNETGTILQRAQKARKQSWVDGRAVGPTLNLGQREGRAVSQMKSVCWRRLKFDPFCPASNLGSVIG